MSWVHAVIDVPADLHQTSADFWSHVLGWPLGDSWDGHPELRSFEPPAGGHYVHLQRISGPARVHIDVEATDPARIVARAVKLGALLEAESETWRTLRSPGGLPFCVLAARERDAPGPTVFDDGHRTRLVQVCIDSPRAVHATEVAFWKALVPGRWVRSPDPEFAGKWHDDDGSPIQLLFQQLDEVGGRVSAHLDLGTDDLPSDVRRLSELGATVVGPGRGWCVLRDPAGHLFCVTLNSPEQTRIRDLG